MFVQCRTTVAGWLLMLAASQRAHASAAQMLHWRRWSSRATCWLLAECANCASRPNAATSRAHKLSHSAESISERLCARRAASVRREHFERLCESRAVCSLLEATRKMGFRSCSMRRTRKLLACGQTQAREERAVKCITSSESILS